MLRLYSNIYLITAQFLISCNIKKVTHGVKSFKNVTSGEGQKVSGLIIQGQKEQ
jgi:hypothetical protein